MVVIKRAATPFLQRLQEIVKLLPVDLGAVYAFVYTPEEFDQMRASGNAFAETVAEEGVLIYSKEEVS